MLEKSRLARVSRNGTLVARTIVNRELSHAIYPNEWKLAERGSSGRSQPVPDLSNGSVHSVYYFPDALANVPYQAVFNETEVHIRKSYCQIVTDYEGGKLRPYRRGGSSGRLRDYDHPTTSGFSASKMGLLRFDSGIGFTIQRASLEVIDGVLTSRTEEVLRDNARCETTDKLTSLPDELSNWQPALTAVLDRYRCDLKSCQGHYHLD